MIKKVWKDPVWSAVIASIITSIFAGIKSLFFNDSTFVVNLLETISSPVFFIILWTIIILLIYKYLKKKKRFNYDEVSYTQDKSLFEQITTKDLPMSFINDYLRVHDFGEVLFVNSLQPLMDFEYVKNNPQYEFNNPLLENIKNRLLSSITSFKDHILENTIEREHGRLTISDAIRRDENRFLAYKNAVHGLANDICKYYDELIRTMRMQRIAK